MDNWINEMIQGQAINDAKSMEYFAQGGQCVVMGEWKAWRNACMSSGVLLDPSEFKKG